MDFANRILERIGFGNQRINMYWVSSAESEKLVKSIEDTLEKVQKSGPNPLDSTDIEAKGEVKEILTAPTE